jgi:hypothetical protein
MTPDERAEQIKEILADHADAIFRISQPDVWTVGDGKWTPEAEVYRAKVRAAESASAAEITKLFAADVVLPGVIDDVRVSSVPWPAAVIAGAYAAAPETEERETEGRLLRQIGKAYYRRVHNAAFNGPEVPLSEIEPFVLELAEFYAAVRPAPEGEPQP